jgi:hypothetical protein
MRCEFNIASVRAVCCDLQWWWLLGWVRAYQASGRLEFLERAAEVFDYVVDNGWIDEPCAGGVMWCPAAAAANPAT